MKGDTFGKSESARLGEGQGWVLTFGLDRNQKELLMQKNFAPAARGSPKANAAFANAATSITA
jgi:hypothetical protein